jgi:hypothetical protein
VSVDNIQPFAFCLLAAPSTPESARQEGKRGRLLTDFERVGQLKNRIRTFQGGQVPDGVSEIVKLYKDWTKSGVHKKRANSELP